MKLLASLLLTIDPKHIVHGQGKSAGAIAKKQQIWEQVASEFNKAAMRSEETSVDQLKKLYQRLKTTSRFVLSKNNEYFGGKMI